MEPSTEDCYVHSGRCLPGEWVTFWDRGARPRPTRRSGTVFAVYPSGELRIGYFGADLTQVLEVVGYPHRLYVQYGPWPAPVAVAVHTK